MAKQHWYEENESGGTDGQCSCELEKEAVMLKRALESIEDLLQEVARGSSRISIQQTQEMEAIIADANVQGLRS